MMEPLLTGYALAVWLGILTSISPCPLAANIAAMSFLAKQVGRTGKVLLSGTAYTLGRAVAYVAIAALIVQSLFSVPAVSNFLQGYLNKLLGPLLIIVGMLLLELISLRFSGSAGSEKLREKAARSGVPGAFFLGMLFALSFCPVSAALFFGRLIPLSLEHRSVLALPSLYAVGTALPVLLFAVAISLGARHVGAMFTQVSRIEWWARRITGVIFILVGIYYCLVYIFHLVL